MNRENAPRRNIAGAIRSFFALNSSMIALLAMVVLVGMGEKMAERFLPLYLMAVGGTTWAVGSLNGMDNLLSALYSFPGGYLSDLLGYKKALIVFNLVAMAGYVIVILVPTWWAVLVGATFFISWTAISLPAIMSLVNKAVPKDKRTMGVSLHSLTRRIPMALGPVVGGALIQVFGRVKGVRISFGVALLLGAVAIVLEVFFITEDPDAGKRTVLSTSGTPSASLRPTCAICSSRISSSGSLNRFPMRLSCCGPLTGTVLRPCNLAS